MLEQHKPRKVDRRQHRYRYERVEHDVLKSDGKLEEDGADCRTEHLPHAHARTRKYIE